MLFIGELNTFYLLLLAKSGSWAFASAIFAIKWYYPGFVLEHQYSMHQLLKSLGSTQLFHREDPDLQEDPDQELHQPALPPEDPAAGTHVRPTTTAMKAYRAGLRRDRNKEAMGGMVEL